jgi:diguanylate cyclase (GGDEF)-like protein
MNHNTKDYQEKHNNTSNVEKYLLNYTFDIISQSNNTEAAMNEMFSEIGKYYDLSRITVFETTLQNQAVKISCEWLNSGIADCKKYDETDVLEFNVIFQQLFDNNNIYYCSDITEYRTDSDLRKVFERLRTRSYLLCAMKDNNQLIGCVSYQICDRCHNWDNTEIDTLTIITKMICNYILQVRSRDALKSEIFLTKAMLDNQKICNYTIQPDTYELLYASNYTQSLYPNIKLGELCYKAIYDRNTPCDICPVKNLNDKNTRFSIEAYNEKMDVWYSSTASSVNISDGKKIYLISSSDVTGFMERVKSRDELTGLLTLSKFNAEAMKLIASAREIHFAIIYTDFNKFKYINDEWGFSVGDEILNFYVKRLSKLLSSSELFCRINGDAFAVLLSYRNKSDALARIQLIYDIISHDYAINYPKINPVFVSGIYFITPEDKVLSNALDKANTAKKTLKDSYKSTYAIYDENINQALKQEKLIEDHMHDALINNEFIVYMQPKVNLQTQKITGAEALVRWKNQDGSLKSPMEFIPVFEKNGFILELDFYVYEKVFQFLREWIDQGKQKIIVSINVSRLHIDDPLFLSKLDQLIEKYQIPADLVEIEITENIFLKKLDGLVNIMNHLHRRGFPISIDDFGSGYSSLHLLKTLPIDIIKIDKEFFMKNTMDEKDKIIISNIIKLAKGLGLKVISEGVETLEQKEFLKENNCDMVQGYFYYKPMNLTDFKELFL